MKTNRSFFGKTFQLATIVIVVSLSNLTAKYYNRLGHVVTVEKLFKGNKLETEKKLFLESFGLAYQELTVSDLRVPDKDVQGFLSRAFQGEIDDLGKPGIHHYRLNDENGNLVAYFSIEEYDVLKQCSTDLNISTFPDHSYYLRQLYVVPQSRRQGLGKLILQDILPNEFPNLQYIYLAVRRLNKVAINFYEASSFKELDKSLHNLPTDCYASYYYEKKY
jgi:ribosomal protein S18 acetylase RimI-like enzyme